MKTRSFRENVALVNLEDANAQRLGTLLFTLAAVLFQTGLSLPPEGFFLSLIRETELIFDEGEEGREL